MSIKFKFKPVEEPYYSRDGFWYDLTDGGYIKPRDWLEDPEQVELVNMALSILVKFKNQAVKNGVLNEDV